MNRHSPLFRVAFISLLLAISLPLLVFTAAQVRHRQLHSTANPRWARFKEVNGLKTAEKSTPAMPNAIDARPEPVETRAESNRLPVRTASQSTGLAGLGTTAGVRPQQQVSELPVNTAEEGQTPLIVQRRLTDWATGGEPIKESVRATENVPVEIPIEPSQSGQKTARPTPQAPGKLSPQQTAELQPTPSTITPLINAPVPAPDDLVDSDPVRPPVVPRPIQKPKVEFRTVETNSGSEAVSNRLEARLAGMQRRLDQLAQAQVDSQMSEIERAMEMLQQAKQGQLPQQQPGQRPFDPSTQAAPVPAPARTVPTPPSADAVPGTGPTGSISSSPKREPSIKIIQGDQSDNDERFSIQVQEANLTEVLEMLGQLAGVNILTSREVQGRISLNLQDVTVDRALDAILKSEGFVHERDGDIIFVRSATEDAARKLSNRKLITKVYQLHYVNANEVQKLIDPVLSKGVGRHAVTSPALSGIAPTPTMAGGDGLSQRDTLLVQDYPEVIAEVDRVIVEIDVPPLQVMIEAKILSVTLSDSMQLGVNFAMLNGASNSQMLSGNGSTLNGSVGFPKNPVLVPAAGDFIANTAGLKYGFIQGDISGFIEALQSIADTTLVASPQLRVLNKQKAEMIIGERLSYKTLAFNGTQTVENVQFLDAGTKLIFRPFISPDGLVRLEVHPERSKATINAQTGLPNSETTEVTTNVMVRDGTTVVLGGLISEEVTESIDRVPLLGAIPLIGSAFQNKTEITKRTELIVLITPRIVVEPEAAIIGEKLQFETEARAANFRDNLSSVNRASLTRAHYDRACTYFEQGNLLKAKQQVDAALVQNKGDLDCVRLKLKIEKSMRDQQAKAWHWPRTTRAVSRP